ncbi:MAG: peptidylprolyl isomerase [Opitutales bacterium]
MKKYLAIAFLSVVSTSMLFSQQLKNAPMQQLSAPAQKNVSSDTIIAIVEGKIITNEDLKKEIMPLVAQIRRSSRNEFEFNQRVKNLHVEVLENLINKVLIVKDFSDKGMQIPQSYLDSAFEEHLKKEFNSDRNAFLKYLQREGKTVKQFKQEQSDTMIVEYMQGQKRRSVSEVSPAKIKEYYEANKAKWVQPDSVKLSQIMLKASETANVEELLIEIIEKARLGGDFAELAKKYSQDKAIAEKGGDWGWYKKGELVSEVDEVAFKLDIGEISEPIRMGDFIYILKAQEKKAEGVQDMEQAREQIEWTLVNQSAAVEYRKWIEKLRKDAYIKYMHKVEAQ